MGGGFALPDESAHLNLTPQTPVLRTTTTITTDTGGVPIELNLGCWPLASV